MSTKGIYTALSGAVAQMERLDTVANNIANANTEGFKKDDQVFYEYLTVAEKNPDVIQVPRIPASIESFYDVQSGDRGHVDSAGTYTDHSQGPLKNTGNLLDLAIEGDGFFEVLTPQGARLTRNGAFRTDVNGTLVNKEGFPVLRSGLGQDPAGRSIKLESRDVTVSARGEIFSNGAAVAELSLLKVADVNSLKKVGTSMFQVLGEAPLARADEAQLHQGFLEASNVNIVKEMTEMINATRNFESTKEAMRAFDSMDDKLMNIVPKAN